MPVYCTRCGAVIREGQRFCDQCGAPVPQIPSQPRAENKPQMDLSSYFDRQQTAKPQAPRQASQQAPRQGGAPSGRPVQAARAAAAPKAASARSDRGLNIALLVLGVLAIAVLTFTIILLLWPKDSAAPSGPAPSPIPIVTPVPAITADPGQQSPTTAPAVQIVTPTPLPSAPAIVTPSPSPTPSPASEYLLPESGSRYLTAADLGSLSHEQLCFARNEIFARHGRIFKTPEIAAYFNSKSWYKGTISPQMFNEKVFNQYESYNIGFIRDYENKYYGGSYY